MHPVDSEADELPAHIQQTVQAIASCTPRTTSARRLQLLVDRLTDTVARPRFIGALLLAVALWICGNLFLRRVAGWSFDSPAFPGCKARASSPLIITTLVLISQRRRDELAELREQLTGTDDHERTEKSAKIVALLEEMRRDNPMMTDRIDPEADAMSTAADPKRCSTPSRARKRPRWSLPAKAPQERTVKLWVRPAWRGC